MRIVLRIGGSVVGSPINSDLISRYVELLVELFGSADPNDWDELRKHLARILDRVEPREGNAHSNTHLYKKLKTKYNELVLRFFLNSGQSAKGFEWFEGCSRSEGLDFLRIGTQLI
jgi:hypothetical protein